MITCSPRFSAVVTKSVTNCGERWADATLASLGTPNSLSSFAQACIVSQSDFEPIKMPTKGFVLLSLM